MQTEVITAVKGQENTVKRCSTAGTQQEEILLNGLNIA